MSHCVRPMTSIGSSHFDMGLNWIPVLGGSLLLLLLLLLLPAPSLWQGGSPSAGVVVGASVEMGAAAGAAAVAEEGKGAAPLTELVAILVAPATAFVFEGTCPASVAAAGASAGDAAAEATAEAACSVDLLDASDMFVRLID